MSKRKCEIGLNKSRAINAHLVHRFSYAVAVYVKIKKLNWRYIDEVNN